jgi:hypothetical protein
MKATHHLAIVPREPIHVDAMLNLLDIGYTKAQAAIAINHMVTTQNHLERWSYAMAVLGLEGEQARAWLSAHGMWENV